MNTGIGAGFSPGEGFRQWRTFSVPTRPDHPGAYDSRGAVEKLKTLYLPWSDQDPITDPWEGFLGGIFKNVAPPLTIRGAGHFLQEDAGKEIAGHISRWMANTP